MKQFFYSYHIYNDGSIVSYGHGAVTVEEESPDAYNEAIREIRKATECKEGNIHLLAFNRVN